MILKFQSTLVAIISKMGTVLKFFKINSSELAIFNRITICWFDRIKRSYKKDQIPELKIPSELKALVTIESAENRLTFTNGLTEVLLH